MMVERQIKAKSKGMLTIFNNLHSLSILKLENSNLWHLKKILEKSTLRKILEKIFEYD